MTPAAKPHPPFLPTLFDFSFRRFIAPRLIPWGYAAGLLLVIAYAVSIGGSISAVMGAHSGWNAPGVIAFIIALFAGAIFLRIQLEVVAVAFRVYERVADPREGPID